MNKTTIAWALVATYFVLACAVPFLDYRGSAFFTTLAVGMLSPFVLVSIALCVAFFYAGFSAIVDLGPRSSRGFQLLALSIACLCFNALMIGWLVGMLSGQALPHWFTHGAVYHAIATALWMPLFGVLNGILLGVPLTALVVGITRLYRRQWVGLKYLAILMLGFGCHSAGSKINDEITVAPCTQEIQEGLEAARDGRELPPLSQAFRFGVLDKNHQIAICTLDGPLFDAQYIGYDAIDVSPASAAERIAGLLDRGQCHVNARRVVQGYYWISEAC